ncbi:Hsp20/alpha crystallin family protein [bacterium]|nr:Hsp20/alpha crystallin family protein [bacterium]
MDEQNNQENQEVKSTEQPKATEPKHQCMKNDCWKKCLAMTLAAFLGGFLAVYFVADNFYHHKMKHNRFHKIQRFNNYDDSFYFRPEFDRKQLRMIENEQAKMLKDFEKTPWSMVPMFANPVKVKAFYDNDTFKVVVDTKNFDKKDSKIEYKINGRKLTVSGKSEVKDKGYESDVEFSQDIILPEKVNSVEAKVSQDENNWVLSIPVFMK